MGRVRQGRGGLGKRRVEHLGWVVSQGGRGVEWGWCGGRQGLVSRGGQGLGRRQARDDWGGGGGARQEGWTPGVGGPFLPLLKCHTQVHKSCLRGG